MTVTEAKADMDRQIADAKKKLTDKAKEVRAKSDMAVAKCCMIIQATAVKLMRDTPPNTDVSYGKHNHHPSFPGNAPAIDYGTLMRSITFNIEEEGGKVVGYVGSTILNPPYGEYLENGTSRMKPRPWLTPAMDINRAKIKKVLFGIVENKKDDTDVTG
jgi:HK97 gp10 family phage protein